MKVTLTFGLFTILLFNAPVFAQNPCVDCLKAAQERLKQCLGNAISQEDKNSCGERQQAKSKACENGECEIERVISLKINDVPPQKK